VNNEALSVIAMCVSNPDCPPGENRRLKHAVLLRQSIAQEISRFCEMSIFECFR